MKTETQMSRDKIEAAFILTPVQRGMLFETLAGEGSGIHVEQTVAVLGAGTDVGVFEAAWRRLVERHGMLRTAFVWKRQKEPLQVVLPAADLEIDRRDWSGLSEPERETELRTFLAEDRRRGFKMNRPPLMRLTLFSYGDGSHTLVWSHHHVLMDGTGGALVLGELRTIYEALREGREPDLPPTRSYRDYVDWLGGRDLDAAEAYWRGTLAGFARPTALGRAAAAGTGGTAGPSRGEAAPREAEALLAASDMTVLTELARRRRLTVNSLVQGAWALLLARYNGAADVVFGVTVAGRPAELEDLDATLGIFINTLPLRLVVDPAAALEDWLSGLQTANLDLRQVEFTPGDALRRWAEVPAALPLFDSILVFENFRMGPAGSNLDPATSAGLDLRLTSFQGAQTAYPLTLLAMPGRELRLRLVYDQERIEGAERILDHLTALLHALAGAREGAVLGELTAVIPEGEIPLDRGAQAGARPIAEPPVPPRNADEELLAALWAEVLGLEEMGVEDDFFLLGGHSLTAGELVARMGSALGIDLPLRLLFENPTVAALAPAVAELRDAGEGPPRGETPRVTRTAPAATPAIIPDLVPDRANRHQPFRLTDVQQAYWIGRSAAFELGNVATHLYLEIEGDGLDPARLETALNRLVERHDMLRAVVDRDGRQRILPEVPRYAIELIDARGSEGGAEAAIGKLRGEMSHQVLPSERWPLFDVRAIALPAGKLRLHMSLDLLIGDAWSWGILFREWALLIREPERALQPLEFSFRDHVLAEEALEKTALYRRSRDYWSRRTKTLPPGPQIPLAKRPADIERPRFYGLTHYLDAAAWSRLKTRAAAAGLTASGVLLAAFAEVLTAWSKEPELTINLTLFNRPAGHPQINDLIGDFTSLTLLEIDGRGATFEERARRLQGRFWDDLDHRAFSGVRVLRELARDEGGPARAMMPVVFTSTLHMSGREDGEGAAAKDRESKGEGVGRLGKVVYTIGQTPQVWLDHQVGENAGRLEYLWEAVEGLFPAGLVEEMFEAYGGLLEDLAAEGVCGDEAWGRRTLASLVPLPHLAERAAVNATEAPRQKGLLHSGFEVQAAAEPGRAALIAGDRTLSYGELEASANRLARWLARRLREPGELVAIVMRKGWEQVAAALAILKAGAAYLPIDAALPPERIRRLLERGQARLALVQEENAIGALEGVETLDVTSAGVAARDEGAPGSLQGPGDLAYVIFTSGSTGEPKGVMIDHGSALNTLADVNARFAIGPGDRVLALSSLSFDLSVWDLFGVLAAGGAVVLPEPAARRDPQRWAELIEEHGVTLWNSVPALLQMLVELVEGRGGRLPSSLRLALLSGDWLPVALADRFRRLCSNGIEVVSLGGATEASIWSILFPVGEVDPAWPSIPYGRPMVNQTFHVLDRARAPRARWVPGELYIGGAGLARGYWRDPKRTAEAFLPHPETGERLYRTGDLGRYLPGGDIEFLGRDDTQIKIQGHRIELGEIEAHLARSPEVEAAVVAATGNGRPDKNSAAGSGADGGERRLVAYVVPWETAPESRGGEDSGGRPEVTDPVARLEFKHRRHGLRRDLPGLSDPAEKGEPAGELERPPGGATEIAELFLERRSHRRFSEEALPLSDLSRTLSALMAVEIPGSPFPKYRYGSPGNLYPVQTYLWIRPGRVQGLAGGAYYYHPLAHRLVAVTPGAELDREVHPLANRPLFDRSAFSIFLVVDFDAITPLYGEISRHFATLEAGLMTQLLEMSAPDSELGLCQIGGLDFTPVSPLLALGENHALLHSLVGGRRPAAVSALDDYLGDINQELELVQAMTAASHRSPQPEIAATADDERLTLEVGASGLPERLRSFLSAALPDYMVPATFMVVDSLPLSANGKVDRKALPAPDAVAERPARRYQAPETAIEEAVAAVWREVLELERVGRGDNFFDLGGHSVAMVQAFNRLQERLEVDFPLVVMFDRPTVRDLAAFLSDQATEKPGERASLAAGQERGRQRQQALGRRRARRGDRAAVPEGNP